MPVLVIVLLALALVIASLLIFGRIMFRRKYMTDKPEAFDAEIAAYRKKDKLNPPASGLSLFVGSSLMEQWKSLADDLAPLPVLNRGISGSKIVQWPFYVERLILPYRPQAVALFAGSNDMHGEKCKPPQRILEAFVEFESKIHGALPETKVYFLSILPSPNKERWGNWGKIQTANRLIKEYTQKKDNLGFIDATDAFLKDGKPVPDYFLVDMVHLNAKGYENWAKVVRAALQP